MTTAKVPTPLAPGSPKLADGRIEAGVLGPLNERGGRIETAKGRFVTVRAAMRWADEVHPDAEVVVLTAFRARTGFRGQAVSRRVNGEWIDR